MRKNLKIMIQGKNRREKKKKSEIVRTVNQHLIFSFSFFSLVFLRHSRLFLLSSTALLLSEQFSPWHARTNVVVRTSKKNYLDTITINEHKAKARTACSSRTNWCACVDFGFKSHRHPSLLGSDKRRRKKDANSLCLHLLSKI